MSNESTQPFNINDNTGQPSHRPDQDESREEVDEQLDDDETITPEDTSGDESA